jgi:hypothetical protein
MLNPTLEPDAVPHTVLLQALLLDRSAFHSLLGKLDSLRSMWRFEVRFLVDCDIMEGTVGVCCSAQPGQQPSVVA